MSEHIPIELEVHEQGPISLDVFDRNMVALESAEIEIIKAISPTVDLIEQEGGVEIVVNDIEGEKTAFIHGMPEYLILDGGDATSE